MSKKLTSILLVLLLILCSLPASVMAAGTLILSASRASAGDTVTASGISAADVWVAVKVLDSGGSIVFFDEIKSDASGAYICSFKVPAGSAGTLKVVAGYANNVASAEISIGGSGGNSGGGGGGDDGGITSTTKPVSSTTGTAIVSPSAGGTVSLGNSATIRIPSGALSGSAGLKIEVTEVKTPSAAPTGFMFLGKAYRLTVGGAEHYHFNQPVTLTFTFDPAVIPPGSTPEVYYYDETSKQWVSLGSTVSGSIITVTVDHFTRFAVLVRAVEEKPAISLTDIAGHWAEKSIRQLVSRGVIAGYPDGTFKPDKTITRAEFVTVLVKALKLEAKSSSRVFSDTSGHWARDSIANAEAHGIVSGYENNTFKPDDPITREQMAVMVVKVAQLAGASGETTFADNAYISPWAQSSVLSGVKAGIIKGYPDNIFKPQGNATRAEAVTVILNTIGSSDQG